MRVRSMLVAVAVLSGATLMTFAAMQGRSVPPRSDAATPPVNVNSINRLPIPANLPIVEADRS